MTAGTIAILGSGETAPGMTKVHRELLASLDNLRPVNLDTTYGFQLNVPQMSAKLEDYFATSLQTQLATLHFSSYKKSSELERTLFKQQVRKANYVFAGPGSPTYALAQWAPLELANDLLEVLEAGGTLCFASAAALTLGAFTAPIYEIYKVGVEDPTWRDGLNIFQAFGLNCVVIPHFDNNEGANYDTRYCYLGEPRLLELEAQLPADVATLGVDEHTALIFDFASDTLHVRGRSNGYWRLNGDSQILPNGTTIDLEQLRTTTPTVRMRRATTTIPDGPEPQLLAELVLAGGPQGLEALAELVQRATTGGDGFIDPTNLINDILAIRERVRGEGNFQIADELRNALSAAGCNVRDQSQNVK
ncbi:MAG TPA: hypothetical protein PLG60_02525 [Acidimicrobiales bacterium]|nr:hypothetical protein [Acidimicrobiales bacterium]